MNMPPSIGRCLAATRNRSPAGEQQSGSSVITLVPSVFGSMSVAAVLGILVSNFMLTHVAHSGLNRQFLVEVQPSHSSFVRATAEIAAASVSGSLVRAQQQQALGSASGSRRKRRFFPIPVSSGR